MLKNTPSKYFCCTGQGLFLSLLPDPHQLRHSALLHLLHHGSLSYPKFVAIRLRNRGLMPKKLWAKIYPCFNMFVQVLHCYSRWKVHPYFESFSVIPFLVKKDSSDWTQHILCAQWKFMLCPWVVSPALTISFLN